MNETRIDQLCDILSRRKVLQKVDIQALKQDFYNSSIASFEDFLIEQGLVEKIDILQALQELYGVTAIDAVGFLFDHHLVHMFPKDLMLRNGFIPYEHDDEVLIVLAAYPDDPELPEIIGEHVSYDVTFVVGLARDIDDAINEYYDESIEIAEREERNLEEAIQEEHPVRSYIEDKDAE